jgi:hypothetical protein
VESHRGGATPMGSRVRTVMVTFPRLRCAPVVSYGGGRHLQHRRGEGQNQLARNGLVTTLTDEGWLRRRRLQMARGGGCAKAAVRLDPGASSVDRGVKWRSVQWFPCTKTEGEMGVRSMMPGGGKREGGEPDSVGAIHGGGGRVWAVDKTRDWWGRSARHASRGGGVRAHGPWCTGRRGLGPESSAPFYLFEKIKSI